MLHDQCPICKNKITSSSTETSNTIYDCRRCGKFTISHTTEFGDRTKVVDYSLSSWIRERNIFDGQLVEITANSLDPILKELPDYSPVQKQRRLLVTIERLTRTPGEFVVFDFENDFTLAWCSWPGELAYYIQALIDRGLLEADPLYGRTDEATRFRITAKGWDYLEEIGEDSNLSDQAFVAMSFSDNLRPAWEEGVRIAILRAGYTPIRLDADPHSERIDVKIINEIRNSRFVVADVTEQKQGVYFEAGFALGIGRPVLWSVRYDEQELVHFDTRQYNHIIWETPSQLAEILYQFIAAIIGRRRER